MKATPSSPAAASVGSKPIARFQLGRFLIAAGPLLADLVAIVISFLLAFFGRRYLGDQGILFDPLRPELATYVAYWPIVLIWPYVLWREGLYPGLWMPAAEEFRRLVQGTTLASLVVISLTFITQTGAAFSRPVIVGWWLFTLLLLPFHHVGAKLALSILGLHGGPVVILGANRVTAQIIRNLRKQYLPALRPVGVFGGQGETDQTEIAGVPVVGPLEQAAAWSHERKIDSALIVLPEASGPELVALAERLSGDFRRILIVPDLIGLSTAETDVRDVEGVLALEIRRNLLSRSSQWAKRLVDLALSALAAMLALPLCALIALALSLERQGSVIFKHERVGRHGRRFTAWKFRTMVQDADAVLARALSQVGGLQAEWNREQKLRVDPRLTRVGKILRRLSLDELPQLWNVFRLEMSLVGPRPIVEAEIQKYGSAIELYYQVLPGLTGLWQVSGRSDLTYEDRVRHDAYYVRNWSIWFDLVILLRTVLAVLTGRGAY